MAAVCVCVYMCERIKSAVCVMGVCVYVCERLKSAVCVMGGSRSGESPQTTHILC